MRLIACMVSLFFAKHGNIILVDCHVAFSLVKTSYIQYGLFIAVMFNPATNPALYQQTTSHADHIFFHVDPQRRKVS